MRRSGPCDMEMGTWQEYFRARGPRARKRSVDAPSSEHSSHLPKDHAGPRFSACLAILFLLFLEEF